MLRTNLSRLLVLLSTAALAAACSDTATPTRPHAAGVGPQFEAVPGPPVLDQRNGTFGYSGTDIRKGFNPTNPRTGDAIIATFTWQGSTNVITSVFDHLANGVPVGNTYDLVDYRTANGWSMATYVALNVQNFPDPNIDASGNPDPDQVLVVNATLSEPITNGGVMLSAYRGVATANALSAHSSNGGSASTATQVSGGAITPGDGSLVYTASFVSPNAPVDGPAGYSEVNFLSSADGLLKMLGAWTVQSGTGTADPLWSWYMSQPTSWLTTNIALLPNGGGGGPTTGDLTVSASTAGADIDPDGYALAVDGGTPQAIGVNDTVAFNGLAAGDHSVSLSGVASNCAVSGSNPRTVTVTAGGTTSVSFAVNCTAIPPTTGDLTIATSTSGASLDPDGYTVTVSGVGSQPIGINGSVTTTLNAGDYVVTLSGVAANCSVSGANPRTVSVTAGGSVSTTFAVSCVAPNVAPVVNAGPDRTAVTGLLYSLSWSFADPDNGPWTYTIDWGDGSYSSGTKTAAGAFSNGHTYGTLLPRTFTVKVTVTDSMGAKHTDTALVTVLLL